MLNKFLNIHACHPTSRFRQAHTLSKRTASRQLQQANFASINFSSELSRASASGIVLSLAHCLLPTVPYRSFMVAARINVMHGL
ncbi:MAG: hypothetical protein AB7P69_09885, partial [Candidatus Binatia bacterium]